MVVFYLILLVLAAACFTLSVFAVNTPKVALVPLGLLFWVIVPLLQTLQKVQ